MFFLRRSFQNKSYFSTTQLSQLLSIKEQMIANGKMKFKMIGLLDQVHKLNMDSEMLKEYIKLFQTLNFNDLFVNTILKGPIMTNISLALSISDLESAARQLLIKAYQVDEVELMREELKQLIYNQEDQKKIHASNLIIKWNHASTSEIVQILEENSCLKKAMRNRDIDFEQSTFHQIMEYKTYDTVYHQKFVKSFSNTSAKDLEPFDLIILAKIIRVWSMSRGFTPEIELLLKKFDHYLEKLQHKCQVIERVILLEELQCIDIPQKIPSLSNPLLNAKIPQEHFAATMRALLQYEDPTNIQQKIMDNLQNITKFSDCISILQGLCWCNNFHSGIFMTLFKRIEKDFEGITDIVKEFPQEWLPHCCRLHQIIVSMQMHNVFVPYMNIDIPVKQLQRLYNYRFKMENHVDFSQNEQDISDILYSLEQVDGWSITKIERQIKVSLFSVDFKLSLKKEDQIKEILLDVLGGSLFVNKKSMSRKALWRYNILAAENDVKFVNLTQWNEMNQRQKVQLIKTLIFGDGIQQNE